MCKRREATNQELFLTASKKKVIFLKINKPQASRAHTECRDESSQVKSFKLGQRAHTDLAKQEERTVRGTVGPG